MSDFQYLSIDEVIEIHDEVIRISGGLNGYDKKRVGLLDSPLEQIQNDDYYPSFEAKVAHLMFACIKFHPFIDGNKRTSIALADNFMRKNDIEVKDFAQQMEDIVVFIAESTYSKDSLQKRIGVLIIEVEMEKIILECERETQRLMLMLE